MCLVEKPGNTLCFDSDSINVLLDRQHRTLLVKGKTTLCKLLQVSGGATDDGHNKAHWPDDKTHNFTVSNSFFYMKI